MSVINYEITSGTLQYDSTCGWVHTFEVYQQAFNNLADATRVFADYIDDPKQTFVREGNCRGNFSVMMANHGEYVALQKVTYDDEMWDVEEIETIEEVDYTFDDWRAENANC